MCVYRVQRDVICIELKKKRDYSLREAKSEKTVSKKKKQLCVARNERSVSVKSFRARTTM